MLAEKVVAYDDVVDNYFEQVKDEPVSYTHLSSE